ncbi:hypothetical protein [Nitrosarchaeum sp. AC2]|uniref:hypothetical protein n=1 Tax=Nitrosarchaeum sp. AC2 TaxID=2259673 RepID=UPI0015C709C9|nr:hypothetical protein [Nitrosarchaeum sp. AC2]QLH11476.1 hypothetical protein DSQ20_08520 [Nitrosarchaeum sp. AC2]
MNDFVESIGLSIGIAFTMGAIGMGIWFLIDKNKRKEYEEKQKKKILTTKEWAYTVFGILGIIQGSSMITIYANTMATIDFSALMSGIGMFLIIGGVLLELRTQTHHRKSIIDLEQKVEEILKKLDEE